MKCRLGKAFWLCFVMYKLDKLWKNKRISVETKKRLMSTLVWPVVTYGCESWTMKKEVLKKIQSFEMAGYRKILRVSWVQKRTNDSVLAEIGNDLELLPNVKARKLKYYGHIMHSEGDNLEKDVVVGAVPGSRSKGRPRRRWVVGTRRGRLAEDDY